MAFDIDPNKGVGPIRLGMSREDVRKVAEVSPVRFRRAGEEDADYFEEVGLFVYFDSSGAAQAIELTEPANATLEGQALIGMSFSEARALLSDRDPAVSVEPDGIISRAAGVGVWAPSAKDDPSAPVETVIVFAKGYYD